MKLIVLCDSDSNEIIALAERLGGEFVNFFTHDRGFLFHFNFVIPTFGEQFIKAAVWYSEFLEVLEVNTNV